MFIHHPSSRLVSTFSSIMTTIAAMLYRALHSDEKPIFIIEAGLKMKMLNVKYGAG